MMSTKPVLFLHSYGLDSTAASGLDLPRLVAPTLPNHGVRRRQREGLSLADMVDEIVGWVGEPVHVVGCSLGAILALHLALDHPELVASLVLACTSASVRRSIILDRADETVAMSEDEFVTSTLRRWFTPQALSTTPSPAVVYADDRLRNGDRIGLAAVWRAVAEHDVRESIHRINVPTTCIAGSQDVSAPPERVTELCDGIPGARLEMIDSAHMAYLEEPEAFSSIVQRHLVSVTD
jgi:3-oxoadipate enol-lactonase